MAKSKEAILRTLHHEDERLTGVVTVDKQHKTRTRFGIDERFHPDMPEDFWDGDAQAAMELAVEIYEREYWQYDGIESQEVADKMFDLAVNMGAKQETHILQMALNSLGCNLLVDNVYGKKTEAAANSQDPDALLAAIIAFGANYYRHIAANNPAKREDLGGWLRRLGVADSQNEGLA